MGKAVIILLAAVCVLSCKSKVTQLREVDDEETLTTYEKAGDGLCNCYTKYSQDLSPNVRKLMERAAKSDNVVATLLYGKDDLNEDEKAELDKFFGKADSQVNKCWQKVFDKYGIDKDDMAAVKKAWQRMKKQDDCDIPVAVLGAGIKLRQGDKEKTDDQ